MILSNISKKVFSMLIITLMVVTPLVSFADTAQSPAILYSTNADQFVPADYSGNSTELIDVKNPASFVSATTTKSYVVSAIATPNTTVSLYSYNILSGRYEIMVSEAGEKMIATVGASGLYAQSVNLNSGKNNIMVVAVNGASTEVVKLEITLNQSLFNQLKSFAVGLTQIFG